MCWYTVQLSGSRCLSGWTKQQRDVLQHRMRLEKPSQSWSSFRYMASTLLIASDLLVTYCAEALPPDISPLESLLPRSVYTTLAQLHSGHCRLLNTYKNTRPTSPLPLAYQMLVQNVEGHLEWSETRSMFIICLVMNQSLVQ